MRNKIINKIVIISIILNSTIPLYAVDECHQETLNKASTAFDGRRIKQNGTDKIICVPNELTKKLTNETCVIKAIPVLSNSTNNPSDPTDNIKCVTFYINIKNTNPSVEIDRLLNNQTFITNAGLYNDTEVLNETNTESISIEARKKAIDLKIKQKIARLKTIQQNLQLSTNAQKSKGNFLDEFIDIKALNPLDALSIKEPWSRVIHFDMKDEISKSKANKVFEKCAKETLEAPTFSLEDMLEMIKSSVFDLESQIETAATGLLDSAEDTIQDAISDQAIMMYTIQGLTKIIAMAVCQFRRFVGAASGDSTTTTAAIMSNVSSNACDKKLDTDDEADTTEDQDETSCWGVGEIGSCLTGSFFAGLTFSFISTDRESDDNAKKACEILEESIKNEAYNECMLTEPDNVMRYILKIINLSAKGGKIEIELYEKCNDKELEKRWKNKNDYDRNGKPNKNRITSFLNSGVDAIQSKRDLMLGYMDDTLDSIRLESLVNQPPKKVEDLITAIKQNLNSKDFKSKYPNISIDMILDYNKKYKLFEEAMLEKDYNLHFTFAINELIAATNKTGSQIAITDFSDFAAIITNGKGMLYRLMASVPSYDFYMNYFMGKDVSGFYTENNVDQIETMVGNSVPTPLFQMFDDTHDIQILEDINDNADMIADGLINSMSDYYDIWSDVVNYLADDFSFNYEAVNGTLTYVIPIKDIQNIMKANFYKIYLKRYAMKKDSNGNYLTGFSIRYIESRLSELHTQINNIKTNSNLTDEEKLTVNKYLKEYVSLILDYNLYLQTYDSTNSNSIISIIDTTNIELQKAFSTMDGRGIEDVQYEFRNFLKFLNQNK
jgi:hypothetical protein